MDEQTMFTLMVDLHRDGERQGPGSNEETRRAIELARLGLAQLDPARLDPAQLEPARLGLTRLNAATQLQVADIGCGTGASTLTLAAALPNAHIVAVDLFLDFLTILAERARAAGYSDRIDTRAESMDALTFEDESLDLIWSEGAIYNMGFTAGLAAWRPFLRPGGVLAVSEITWLRPDPPAEIREYWHAEYPEIATAPEKIAALERGGYDLLGYFVLPPTCWIDNYYAPTEQRIPAFLDRHRYQPEAAEIVEMERREIELYRQYQDWFSYGFYVAQKR